jgi:hypothetical protein
MLAVLGLLTAPLLAPPGAAAAPPPLQLGFGDSLFSSSDAATREYWLERAKGTGASLVRINVNWSRVAPKVVPPGFSPTDPASPGYRWDAVDAVVRSAAAHGLRIMFTVDSAPAWAEGPGRPAGVATGTWEPQPAAFGEFARALASRYSGSFPDPLLPGAALPAVRFFEAWNEPNLDTYLAPQWQGTRSTGPGLYRELLNGFYAGIKAVQPSATVVGGSLAPFGDEPGGSRTRPVLFLRNLLCLHGGRLKPAACPRPARLDVLSDHPIAVGPPSQSALSPLDVTTPNLDRLTRVLRKAEQAHTVRPAGHKPLWVTEFWYDSNPPDPDGVPLFRQARWYEQALYMFWRQGASVAIGLQLRDSPPGKGYPYTLQSGAFFVDGSPKPSQTAFRFPFVTQRSGREQVDAWGISPRRGKVRVQILRDGRWTTAASTATRANGRPFSLALRLRGRAQLRAVVDGEASLPWMQS